MPKGDETRQSDGNPTFRISSWCCWYRDGGRRAALSRHPQQETASVYIPYTFCVRLMLSLLLRMQEASYSEPSLPALAPRQKPSCIRTQYGSPKQIDMPYTHYIRIDVMQPNGTQCNPAHDISTSIIHSVSFLLAHRPFARSWRAQDGGGAQLNRIVRTIKIQLLGRRAPLGTRYKSSRLRTYPMFLSQWRVPEEDAKLVPRELRPHWVCYSAVHFIDPLHPQAREYVSLIEINANCT